MKSLRLIIDATSCDAQESGARRRHLELWPRVMRLCGAQLEVVLLTSPAAEPAFRKALPQALVDVVPGTPASALGRLRVNRLLRRWLHTATAADQSFIHQETLPLARPAATLFCRHDARLHRAELSTAVRKLYADLRLPRLLRAAARVITVSTSAARELAACTGRAEADFAVIPNGIHRDDFAPLSNLATILSRMGLEAQSYRLLLGHLEPRKNARFAIELEARLRDASVPGALVLAGRSSSYLSELEGEVARLHLEGRVKFLTRVDEIAGRALLQGAQLVLQPSLLEGFSLVPLEAWASGRPVLASAIPAHEELLGPAFCLPLDLDRWQEAVTSKQFSACPAAAEARLQHYSWERAAASFVALLRPWLE